MDNLLNFLNTLLGIEIAVFGIISAVILVFVQLVYSNYSYKHIGQILKNGSLLLFFVFSIIDLILTSAGSYNLLFNAQILPPALSPLIGTIITSQVYVIACWSLIIVSISFFITLIVKNITYLQPHRAIFLLAKGIRYDTIRNILWRSYELRAPYSLQIQRVSADDEEDSEDADEEIRFAEAIEDEDSKKFAEINKRIRKIKKQTANAEDPLLPIRDMMIQFIRRADLSSLTEARELVRKISVDFVYQVPKKNTKEWSPNDSLLPSFTRYQIELLSTLLEIAEKEGLESAQRVLLGFAYGFALSLFEKGGYPEFDLIQKFLQKVADKSIGRSSTIFQEILDFYQTASEKVFDSLKEKSATELDSGHNLELLEDVFRSVGWLGERLLVKLPPEESPLMLNSEHGTEYEALLNCVLTFSHRYNHEQPGSYPHIYFDCVYVILNKLAPIYKASKIPSLSGNIYDLSATYATFAEAAIRINNSRGASLAALRTKEAYQITKKAGLNKEAKDIISLLVKIGIMAAGKAGELEHVEFMSDGLDVWVADALVASGENIDGAVFEGYIDTIGANHDVVWEFITKLGVRMGSNFGLAFDPATGERYQQDDPRRR